MLVKRTKFGVYVPEDLLSDLNECMKAIGIKSKSKLIQEALRLFITEHRWRTAGEAVGIIGVVYDHKRGHVDEELTDIQHQYLDIIIATLHIHLDEKRCMLAIVVRGDTERLKSLLGDIHRIKGIMIARPLLLDIK